MPTGLALSGSVGSLQAQSTIQQQALSDQSLLGIVQRTQSFEYLRVFRLGPKGDLLDREQLRLLLFRNQSQYQGETGGCPLKGKWQATQRPGDSSL